MTATQSALSAGARLSPDDYGPIAHLITLGEGRTPGALLGAYPAQALQALAEAVVHSDAVFGLFGGYAAWDGADPQPEDDSAWADGGFNPDSGRWSLNKSSPSGSDHNLHGASPGYGGGPQRTARLTPSRSRTRLPLRLSSVQSGQAPAVLRRNGRVCEPSGHSTVASHRRYRTAGRRVFGK
jgi:hypothetical protein